VMSANAARAEDDEDDSTFEEKIIKQIMTGIGGTNMENTGIEYRERSPLVIPPTRDLPVPDSADGAVDNPSWPKDPDQRRQKAAAKSTKFENGSLRSAAIERATLSPSELKRGAAAGKGRVTQPGTTDNLDPGRQLRPSELGHTGGLWSSIWGYKEEEVPFTGEPPRTSLTQPPTGYQTPSTSYPYGVGKDKNKNATSQLPIIKDHATAAGQ